MPDSLNFILFFALTSPLVAQNTTWYVDPLTGDDTGVNTGTSALDPFQTVTHAMTIAVSSDTVELMPGTYTTGGVPTPGLETFPINITNGVSVIYPGSNPAICRFEGSSTPNACFRLAAVMDDNIELRGFSVSDFGTGIDIAAGSSTNAHLLNIEGCDFEIITVDGVRAELAGATEIFWVRDCNFAGTSATGAGVSVVLGSGAVLSTSVVQDCIILGFDIGVSVTAGPGAAVITNSSIQRNYIDGGGSGSRGIVVAGSGDAVLGAITGLAVAGNSVTGFTGAGLYLEAASVSGRSVLVNGDVDHNLFFNNGVNVRLVTINNGASGADISSKFVGNVFSGATTALGDGYGVVMDATLPKTGGVNMAPDFGDFSSPPYGGRNTFSGNEVFNMVLDADMQNIILAERNFWGDLSTANVNATIETPLGANYPSILPLLADSTTLPPMSFTVSPASIYPDTATLVTLTADSFSAFVDNDDSASNVGQMLLVLDGGIWLLQPVVTDDGFSLSFTSPELTAGTHDISLINPGGQFASGNLEVDSPSPVFQISALIPGQPVTFAVSDSSPNFYVVPVFSDNGLGVTNAPLLGVVFDLQKPLVGLHQLAPNKFPFQLDPFGFGNQTVFAPLTLNPGHRIWWQAYIFDGFIGISPSVTNVVVTTVQ